MTKSTSPGDIELLSIQLLVRWLQRGGIGDIEKFKLLFSHLSNFNEIGCHGQYFINFEQKNQQLFEEISMSSNGTFRVLK